MCVRASEREREREVFEYLQMSEEGTELRLKVAITSARPLGMLEAELNGMDGKVSLKSREKQRKEGRRNR